jgi:hypothetical protein
MHIKALPAALALLAALCTPPSLAQSNVILPSSPEDYSKLAKPALPPGPCTTCGVVTNVRSDQIEVSKKAPPPTPGGPVLQGAPIIGTGTTVQDGRKSLKQTSWKVTVRYDNGQYATFDQSDEPSVRKGDKVRVAEGRVQPL